MRRYFDNDDYPSPSSKSYKAEPSEPSVQDDTRTQTLATGGAQDIEQYHRVVGEIAGLNIAEQEIQTLNKNMEDIDD